MIDFHVHLFPDKLFDAIWSYFASVYGWEVLYRYYAQECISYLHQQGVSHIVYSNYAHRKGVARGLNRWSRELLDKTPHLYCFAAFHPDDDDAISIAEEIVDHPKVLGFKLQLLVQNFYPHDERLFPLYELVMDRGKRILFHAGTGPVGNPFVGYEHFIQVMKRYPDLHANVAHMGGFEYKPFIDLLEVYENLYLDTSFSFFKSPPLRFDLDPSYLERHQEKLVYGSDFPNLILPREEEIEVLKAYRLSDEFYQRVFHDNGIRLLQQHSDDPALTDTDSSI